jgi:hypothetical protein
MLGCVAAKFAAVPTLAANRGDGSAERFPNGGTIAAIMVATDSPARTATHLFFVPNWEGIAAVIAWFNARVEARPSNLLRNYDVLLRECRWRSGDIPSTLKGVSNSTWIYMPASPEKGGQSTQLDACLQGFVPLLVLYFLAVITLSLAYGRMNMKRQGILTALAFVLFLAGTARAEVWNLANDFYTTTQHTPWLYGAINMSNKMFYLFDGQSSVANGNPGGTFAGWLSAGEGWDQYGSLGKNLGPGPCSCYGFYTEVGDVRVQGGNLYDSASLNTSWIPGALWRAPQDGQYQVTATFTGTWYADHVPETSPMFVFVKEGYTGGYTDLTTGALTGFIGTAANNYTDGWGDVREVTYSATLSLTAGEDLLFLAGGNGAYGHSAGLGAAISTVPEPTSLVLLFSSIVGLVAYAYRKR